MELKITLICLILSFFVLNTSMEENLNTTINWNDGSVIDLLGEPLTYCGLNLQKSVRKFCHKNVTERVEDLTRAGILKSLPEKLTKRCKSVLINECCAKKCTISEFVSLCPYHYDDGKNV